MWRKTGLPYRRFYDLRHTCATLLLVQGVHPRVVMEILGHSQISLTMNTYSHVVPTLQEEAASRMDEVVSWEEQDIRILKPQTQDYGNRKKRQPTTRCDCVAPKRSPRSKWRCFITMPCA
jgi:hypothetical protein